MKNILLILMICLQNFSCNKRTQNCVDGFLFKRHYDAPAPDNITFKTELSKEYKDKMPDGGFSHINFYINKKDFFKTHDTSIYIDKDTCYFSINTTYFNRKKNFTEEDFYKLINSSDSLNIELIYDHTGEKFTFIKCR